MALRRHAGVALFLGLIFGVDGLDLTPYLGPCLAPRSPSALRIAPIALKALTSATTPACTRIDVQLISLVDQSSGVVFQSMPRLQSIKQNLLQRLSIAASSQANNCL